MRTQIQNPNTTTPTDTNTTGGTVSKITGDGLISFINGASANVGRSTFYNLPEEQREALVSQHTPMLKKARPFYALMSLAGGINDINKQLIAFNLVKNTLRETGLKEHEPSKLVRWESELIFQAFENMQPNRVFDLFVNFASAKLNRRSRWFIHEYLKRNCNRWELWAIKYRKEFKIFLKHAHTNGDVDLKNIWRYLKYGEDQPFTQGIIRDYEDVRKGDQSKLAKLPISVAEGFQTKFGLTKEEFDKLFMSKGGKLTNKEKRTRATSMKKSGVNTGFDPSKVELFDLLVYWHSLSRLPMPTSDARKVVSNRAKDIAKKLSFTLSDVAVIVDNSKSMFGSKDAPYHPMLRALATTAVLKEVTDGSFEVFYTNHSNHRGLFPKLGEQSNYGDPILEALSKGFKTIILVGDGYENAPYSGYAHQILYTYKKKVDKNNDILFLHLNPVYGAEVSDVRKVTDLVHTSGIREIRGLDEAMFLALAKSNPEIAVQRYAANLASKQNPTVAALMPTEVKKMFTKKNRSALVGLAN